MEGIVRTAAAGARRVRMRDQFEGDLQLSVSLRLMILFQICANGGQTMSAQDGSPQVPSRWNHSGSPLDARNFLCSTA